MLIKLEVHSYRLELFKGLAVISALHFCLKLFRFLTICYPQLTSSNPGDLFIFLSIFSNGAQYHTLYNYTEYREGVKNHIMNQRCFCFLYYLLSFFTIWGCLSSILQTYIAEKKIIFLLSFCALSWDLCNKKINKKKVY